MSLLHCRQVGHNDGEDDKLKGEGLILAGFPRTLGQARAFEQTVRFLKFVGSQCNLSKFSLRPMAVLLDCSELELGRNLGERKVRVDHHHYHHHHCHYHHQDHQTKVEAHDQDSGLLCILIIINHHSTISPVGIR